MKNKKILSYVGLGALALAFFFGLNNTASAFMGGNSKFGPNLSADESASMQEKMFQEKAELLGLSVAEIKEAWASGKSFKDLAKEKGISEETLRAKMQTKREAYMKSYLSTLVSKGIITQAQADSRLSFMKNNLGKMLGKEKNGNQRGSGNGKKIGHMIGWGNF